MGEKKPLVTVIMPIRNEESYIKHSLGAILAQTYPSNRMEVLVVDGMSNDATRHYIQEQQTLFPNLHLVDNPHQIVPTAMNLGIQQSKGVFIVRVDGHTKIAPDYVEQCVSAWQETKADNVGGLMNAEGHTFWGETVALATSSPFGVGGARFHYSQKSEWVDTVYMGAWPKPIFEQTGLFDEEMVRNQDDEFNYRLRKNGGRIWLSTKIKSTYTPRGTWASFYRQYYQYGFWKIRVLQKHPKQMRLRQFVPAAFVSSLLVASLFTVITPLALLWPLFYILCAAMGSIYISKDAGYKFLSPLILAFATMHIAYGLGTLVGFFYFANRWPIFQGKPSDWRPNV